MARALVAFAAVLATASRAARAKTSLATATTSSSTEPTRRGSPTTARSPARRVSQVRLTTPLTSRRAVFASLVRPYGTLKVRVVRGRHAGRPVSPVARAARSNALGRRLLRRHRRLEVQVRYGSLWIRLVLRPPRPPAAPSAGA